MTNNNIEVQGYCEEKFLPVKQAYAENFETGFEVGSSFAATVDGRFVVDIWGGYADKAKTRPWTQNTIVNVFSATKVMTAVCTMMLVDRGLLDLDAPVAKYWPEFAANGKEKLPVRYLLSHSSGLAGFDTRILPEQMCDWDYAVNQLASQAPLWEPGTKSGYHGLSMGYLLGEVLKRITGKTMGTFFREEVAEPLDIEFYIGLPESKDEQVAEMIPAPPAQPGEPGYEVFEEGTIREKVRLNQLLDHGFVNQTIWRRAEIPAANGHGNAHAMAKVAAVLACGGELDGVRLMSPETVELMLEEQTDGIDLVLNTRIRWGLGVELTFPERPLGPHPRTFSWGGAGGSMIVVDLDARVGWAYAMNQMGYGAHFLEPRNQHIAKALNKIIA